MDKDYITFHEAFKTELEGLFKPKYTIKLVTKIKYFIKRVFSNIKSYYYDLFYGIENSVYYFRVIWKDRDWDYEYILDLLHHKLKRVSVYMDKYGAFKGKEKVILQINNTIKRIESFLNADDIYETKAQDLLREIKNTKDNNIKMMLQRKYFKECLDFEEKQWRKIWENIKNNGRKWWY